MRSPKPEDLPTPALLRLVYNRLVERVYEAVRARATDLRPSHGNVLEQLDVTDGLRLTDLARGAGMAPQSIGELVDQLERMGYVERRPDPEDRRAKRVHLTEHARRYQRTSRRAAAGIERELTGILGERGHASLRRALVAILEARGPAERRAGGRAR